MKVFIDGVDPSELPPPGSVGQVLTLDADLVPDWQNGGGGGGTHGVGLLEDRPLVPTANDTYTVDDGVLKGDKYSCLRDGEWTFIGRGDDQRFALGQGFELVFPGSSPNAGTSVASFEPNGIGRLSIATAGDVHDATGALIRRELTWGASLYRAQVRLIARGAYTGSAFSGLYFSDASGTSLIFVASGNGAGGQDEVIAGNWSSLYDPRIAGEAPWDGDTILTLQIQATTAAVRAVVGIMRGTSWSRPAVFAVPFTPAFVGVCGLTDGPASVVMDYGDFSVESFG
jgi:hypothetical protein